MRAYPITQFELWALGGLGLATSVMFSIAAGLLNFIVDTARDLDLTQSISPEQRLYWTMTKTWAFWGMCGAIAIGILLAVAGGFAILKIIDRTRFPE